jgi:peptidoglycan/LPS O-acetylase OafA/YrhL
MSCRLRALDGLRGMLALYILAGHMAPFLLLPTPFGWLAGVLSHGRAAVELFFVLSGMVILRSLGLGESEGVSARQFLAARAGRLLPVYLIALAVAAAVLCLGDPLALMPWLAATGAARDIAEPVWPQPWLGHIAAHLTLTQGILPPAVLPNAEFSILGPAWSLSTEWQFYLLVAAILAFGPNRPRHGDSWRPFLLCVTAAGLIGLAMDALPPVWQPGRAFLPHEAWYFALGIASHAWRITRGRAARGWWCLAAVSIVGLAWHQTPLTSWIVPAIWASCLFCDAPRPPLPLRPLAALLNGAPLQWVGGISYPLYLIHAPIQRLLMLAVAPVADGRWAMFSLIWGPLAVLLPFAAAYALHRWVEVPCWQWSRRRARKFGKNGSFLVLFFKKEPPAGLEGRPQAK